MFNFELISEDDVETTQRGRQPSQEAQAIAEILEPQSKGAIIRIEELRATNDADKVTKGNQIRSGAKIAGRKVGIRWSPAGVPQIEMKD
jgi:hypothetical protein